MYKLSVFTDLVWAIPAHSPPGQLRRRGDTEADLTGSPPVMVLAPHKPTAASCV